MSVFSDRQLLTPFGEAICGERVDMPDNSYWICWQKETGICFWWTNDEVRLITDWSDGRYRKLPFQISPARIAALDPLGKHHGYWRDTIKKRVSRHDRLCAGNDRD